MNEIVPKNSDASELGAEQNIVISGEAELAALGILLSQACLMYVEMIQAMSRSLPEASAKRLTSQIPGFMMRMREGLTHQDPRPHAQANSTQALLTATDAARRLGISTQRLPQLADEGILVPSLSVQSDSGKTVRLYTLDDVESMRRERVLQVLGRLPKI